MKRRVAAVPQVEVPIPEWVTSAFAAPEPDLVPLTTENGPVPMPDLTAYIPWRRNLHDADVWLLEHGLPRTERTAGA